MKPLTILMLSILMMLTFQAKAQEHTAPESSQNESPVVRYHPTFKKVPIPNELIVAGEGVVHAPLGEVTVQSPIVIATVNGKGPYYFMVDTGFSITLLSKRVAKETGLDWLESKDVKWNTPTQELESSEELYFAKYIQLGDLTLKDFGVYTVGNQDKEYEIFNKVDGRGIDGIIGFNAFYGMIMTLDYQHEQIKVSTQSLKKGEPYVTNISVRSSVPQIRLHLKFDKLKKQEAQNFVIDTGAFPYFFINSCLIPEMKNFVGKEVLSSSDFHGTKANSYFAQLYGSIELLEGYAVKSPYIVYSAFNCHLKPHGLLGRKFFLHHKVSIDVDDFLVKIEPYKE